MKKIILLIMILLFCTSCNKSVTCKDKSTNNNYKITVTDDDKIKKIVLTYIVNESTERQAIKAAEDLKTQFGDAENFSHVKVKRNGKEVTLIADVDYSFFFSSNHKSIEEVKDYFQKELDMKCYE